MSDGSSSLVSTNPTPTLSVSCSQETSLYPSSSLGCTTYNCFVNDDEVGEELLVGDVGGEDRKEREEREEVQECVNGCRLYWLTQCLVHRRQLY